ncbi:MAG TPA: P1 family peptidase, partial [Longimicrobiales bacterium]|nr:P1 family peptidase [Longimicrobiales bacterium]
GATVGKLAGPDGAQPGGVGSWAERAEPWTVGALAVVNALGDVRGASGAILAGARTPAGTWLDGSAAARRSSPAGGFPAPPPAGTNTTLAVVATDAPLTRTALQHLARAASVALARRIAPVHTPFDGDVTFALSTATDAREQPPAELLRLGETAAFALEQAIERAVLHTGSGPAGAGA